MYAYLDNAITQMVQDTRFEHEAFFTHGEFGLHVKGPGVARAGEKIQFLLEKIELFKP